MSDISRRQFLKIFGAGTVATAAVAAGCKHPNNVKTEGGQLGEVPTDQMTYRTDQHGERVSLLGFGMMRLPTLGDKNGDKENKELDQEEINQLVDYAIAHGVNLFDTAPRYCKGQSEQATGIALSRHPRNTWRVSTKMSNFPPSTWSFQESKKIFENSLKSLQTDYVDFLMLHSIGGSMKDEHGNQLTAMQTFERRFIDNGLLDWLVEQREKGRIRNLGFSYHGDVAVFDHCMSMHDKIHWNHVLIQHSYVDYRHAKQIEEENTNSEYLYSEADKRGIPCFVMEPLLGGRLAELNEHATQQLKEREPDASIASWAFRFAGTLPRILTVLSGMNKMEHLQDNIRTYSPLKPLSDDEFNLLQDIAAVYANYPLVPCTSCQYCMPCPYGIDIPSVFQHFNRCLNEGNIVDDSHLNENTSAEKREYRRARRAFLVGYDRSMPRLRQADHCIGCNHCVPLCPQGIDIPVQMRRIDQYVESLKQTN